MSAAENNAQHNVFLSLGTNLGNKQENLEQAQKTIASFATITKQSLIYETKPWGIKEQPAFLNQIICIKTTLEPVALLTQLQNIEMSMGRMRIIKDGPRIIDIDILFFDDLITQTDKLIIPHPGISNRATVLKPLCDIAPDFIHPVENKTIRELLHSL